MCAASSTHGAAGEIGHTPGYSDLVCTCGQVGHLETLASGRSIELRYAEAAGVARSAAAIADLARTGDPTALAVLACVVTATPGTAWIEYRSRRDAMLIHVLDLVEEQDWIDLITGRYEPLLKEIFE